MRSVTVRCLVVATLWVAWSGLSVAVHAGATQAAPAACRPAVTLWCVGRSDGGHTVRMRKGQYLTVDLNGGQLRWSGLHQVGPGVLRLRGRVVSDDAGLTAGYQAVKVGRGELQANGAPRCAAGQACPQFILLWQVRVVVLR